MGKNIIHLPEEFIGTGEVKGFKFKQIKKNNDVYLYEVTSFGRVYYEVFKAQTNAICIDFKKHIYSDTDFKHSYPKAKSFGKTAWTCSSYVKAIKYYNNFL